MTNRAPDMRSTTVVAGLAAGALVTTPAPAQAFEGLMSLCLAGLQRVTPDTVWRAWSLAPEALLPLVALIALFVYGTRSAPRAAMRRMTFLAGWSVLVVALVSPLCRLSATLVSAHMVQHMLLVTAAPILLALARPGPALAAALSGLAARHRKLPDPPRPSLTAVTLVYGAAIWLWHAPAVYTTLLTSATAHVLGTAILITAATVFWGAILATGPRRAPAAIVALLATMAHTGLLGALLTFSARPFYPILAPGALDWGLAPLADQQIAGLIMWVPGGIVFMAAALALGGVWLRRMERANSPARRLQGRSA